MLSAYDISIIATIIVTTLIAFYLLYSAKELNLGIVIAISFGAVTLGILFNPTFKVLLDFLSQNMNFNRKFALVLALVIILLIFLVAVLILSLILSLVIPKKFLNIDLGIYIDRFISMIINFFKKTTKSIGELKYKFKKPVDTVEIIDKMGIDVDNQQVSSVNSSIEMEDSVTYPPALDLATAETSVAKDNDEAKFVEIEQQSELDIAELVAAIEEAEYKSEFETTELKEANEEAEQRSVIDIAELVAAIEDAEQESELDIAELEVVIEEAEQQTEFDIAEVVAAIGETEQLEIAELGEVIREAEQVEDEINNLSQEQQAHDSILDISTTEIDSVSDNIHIKQLDLSSCILKAMEYKDAGRKSEAIECYMTALEKSPTSEMVFWIVLDICALYKQLGLSTLAQSILDGLAAQFDGAIAPEVRAEIMNNLK